jgi:hypothetical protein
MSETLIALDQGNEYSGDPIDQARQAALDRGAWREGYPSGEAFLVSDPERAEAYVEADLSTRFPNICLVNDNKKEK